MAFERVPSSTKVVVSLLRDLLTYRDEFGHISKRPTNKELRSNAAGVTCAIQAEYGVSSLLRCLVLSKENCDGWSIDRARALANERR